MASPEPPKDVPEFGKIQPGNKTPGEEKSVPDKAAFDEYMSPQETTPSTAPSPMDITQKGATSPTTESVLNQIDQTTNLQNEITNNLNTPNLQLKNSHEKLLDTKLTEANSHLDKASEHLGANVLPKTEVSEGTRPVAKFLGYLTDGQNQLVEAKKKLQDIQSQGGELKPSQLMLIQVNLAQAQQQIEFSSVLLSKAVDTLKQTINIQL